MKRALLLATTILAGFGNEALAGQRSSSITPDAGPGIRVVACSPTKRVELTGLIGQPLTISFPEGESVYRIDLAFNFIPGEPPQASWRIPDTKEMKEHPLGNNITIWPLKPSVEMMSIITARDPEGRGQRVHPFRIVGKETPKPKPEMAAATLVSASDVVLPAPVDQPDITYNVICKYAAAGTGEGAGAVSDEDTAARNERRAARRAAREFEQKQAEDAAQAAAGQRLLIDAFNRERECHYDSQPRESPIKPKCPLDNGQWTMMRFPGLSDKPAVFKGLCDGKTEQTVRQHGFRDFVVVEDIAPSFCLRLGGLALNVINNGYNPAGAPTGNGTIAPGHRREIIQAKSPK